MADILAGYEAVVTELKRGARTDSARSRRTPAALALTGFLSLLVLLTLVISLAHPAIRYDQTWLQGPTWLDAWIQYDSTWYYSIATQGYFYIPGQQSSIAFFPTYPMMVRGLAAITGDAQIAGMLLTALAGAGALTLFGLWATDRLSRRAAITAVLLLLLYPYSFFLYGTMYADAMFLLAVIGAFVLLERRHPVLAGMVGILATAGRPVGIAVLVGLAVRAVELRVSESARASGGEAGAEAGDEGGRGRARLPLRTLVGGWRSLRPGDYGVLLSGLGLAGWCVYLWTAFGDPLAFVKVESAPGWDQGSGPRTWFKISLVELILQGSFRIVAVLLVQGLICLAAVLLLRRVWRRFGWGYLAYCVVVLVIPILGSKDFMGCGRYVLAAFPVFAAAADLLTEARPRWLRPLVIAGSGVGLLIGALFYARGYEVS